MTNKHIEQLIADSLAIEAEAATEAGTLGYMARALVQATMPHSKPSKIHSHQASPWAFYNIYSRIIT